MHPCLEATRDYWGDALDLGRVRVVESRAARTTGRAFVVHDTIGWPGPPPAPTDAGAMATLVHELAHCWQYQIGRWQLTRGLVEQTLYTLFGLWLVRLGARPLYDPYDYGGPAGLAATARLGALRLEAQAAVIEHRWRATEARARSVGDAPLVDAEGGPTPYALDLERLCVDAGLPPRL